jgi:uncharacterized membrane protein (UPF0136 family)
MPRGRRVYHALGPASGGGFQTFFGHPGYAAVFLAINGLILLAGERFRRRSSLAADEVADRQREDAELVAAGVSAYLSVRFLLRYLRTRTLTPFGIYCLLAGVASFVYLGVIQ